MVLGGVCISGARFWCGGHASVLVCVAALVCAVVGDVFDRGVEQALGVVSGG